jgi:hypothetical protein
VRNDMQKGLQTLESNLKARYSMLKRRLSRVAEIIYGPNASNLTPSTIKELAQLVITDKNFEEQLSRLTTQHPKQSQPASFDSAYHGVMSRISALARVVAGPDEFFRVIKQALSSYITSTSSRRSIEASDKTSTLHPIQTLQQQDDFAFATALQSIAEKDEVFNEVVQEFRVLMIEPLKPKIRKLSSSIPATVKERLHTSINRDLSQAFEQRKQEEEAAALQNLKEKVQELLSQAASNVHDG